MSHNYYAVPELAEHYDRDCAGRDDLPFYLELAGELGADAVADIGAGTGLLCSLLAERGHRVTGAEPQRTMLDLAHAQPYADRVRWIHGTAADLPDACADLVVMTGHVAQYFLDDASWAEVLRHARRVLRPGGHVAFEIRNAAAEAWRAWDAPDPQPVSGGTLRKEVRREGDLVTHTGHFTFGDRTWTTVETLRFPAWDDVVRGLAAADLSIVRTWGDFGRGPVGPDCPEWVVLASGTAEARVRHASADRRSPGHRARAGHRPLT